MTTGEEIPGGEWGGRPWHSPDVGDEVEITVRGRIVAREMRDGLDCVAVEVPGMLNPGVGGRGAQLDEGGGGGSAVP